MAVAATAAAEPAARVREDGAARERLNRAPEEVKVLKVRDNTTNWVYLARIYAIIAASIASAIYLDHLAMSGQIAWWWSIPITALAIVAVGASQHQFGGVVHEGTHYMLFANRKLNELASDWFGAFPILTTTFHFRLHHLAHHQFINDPERDPDICQLQDSDHWLDFPITHVEMMIKLLKQLWLPNLIRYTLTRARYSATGGGRHRSPYELPDQPPAHWPLRIGLVFTVLTPAAIVPMTQNGNWMALWAVLPAMWAATVGALALLPEKFYMHTRLDRVISHKVTAIGRVTHLALLFAFVSYAQLMGWAYGAAWSYFALLWVLPVFTTFPLFMILRQWVQHGNADRGRYTNTRVFLVGPLVRYAVFPFGMDYHLPHHMIASVPHYNLPKLHDALMRDPEYREKGVVVEGYFGEHENERGNPTALSVLGPKHAPKKREAVFVDTAALEHADVVDAAGLQREVEASLSRDV